VADADRFAAALVEVLGELDWDVLGAHYCHDGDAGFFDAETREGLLDGTLRFASDVASALDALGRPAEGGRSLYVGAALSELGPVLCETLVLGRTVDAFSLDGAETRELNRALAEVGRRLGRELVRIRTGDVTRAELPAFDHLWIVSVLDDPEAFPALHDELYERSGTELATGRGDAAEERERARRLLDHTLGALARPALLTCSDEELPLVRPAVAERALELSPVSPVRLSPIVGDPVRTWLAR
jgi:hypothetical protein